MRKFVDFVDSTIVKWFLIGTYCYFCLIILVEVIRRYVFGASSQWGEMTARYAFVYLVYVAAAEAIHFGRHIRIDLVPNSLSPGKRRWLELYVDALTVLLAGTIIFYSLKLMHIQWSVNIVMTAVNVNMAFAQAALPIGWALIVVRIIQSWLDRGSVRWSSPATTKLD